MITYRHKPWPVDAYQWQSQPSDEWPVWLLAYLGSRHAPGGRKDTPAKMLSDGSLELTNHIDGGYLIVRPGEWVVKDMIGTVRAYSDNSFQVWFEKAEDP